MSRQVNGSGSETDSRPTPLWFRHDERRDHVSLLWIILIVVLVLALLGFFGRGYW